MRKSIGQAPTAGEHEEKRRTGSDSGQTNVTKTRVRSLPTSERNRKIILSDEVWC